MRLLSKNEAEGIYSEESLLMTSAFESLEQENVFGVSGPVLPAANQSLLREEL